MSGRVALGDPLTIFPGVTASVKRIVTFDGDLDEAFAPMSVTDQEVDVSRGDVLAGGPVSGRQPHRGGRRVDG